MKKMTKEQRFQEEREIYLKLAKSSLLFVEKMFGLTPQPCKPEYKYQLEHILSLNYEDWEETKGLITADWFGDYDEVNHRYTWYDFQKGKHITWQQFLIMTSYDKALNKQGLSKISITSGHGIGKANDYNMELETPQGKKRWGDLDIGDFVFDENGLPTKIIETHHYKNMPNIS